MLSGRVVGVLVSTVTVAVVTAASYGAVPLRTVVLTGKQAPGMPAGVIFGTLGLPDINAAGRTAFSATFSGIGVTADNDATLWSDRSGTLAHVFREGQQAPGTPMMVVFKSFGTPKLNSAGRLSFGANLKGVGVDFTNDSGIWSEGVSGVPALIAREGNPAVGMPANILYSQMDRSFFNDEGRVSFSSTLKGPGVDLTNNKAIWTGFPMGLSLIARDGAQANALPAGVLFNFPIGSLDPVLGGNGRVAFAAGLTGAGVTPDNSSAVLSGTAAMMVRVARKGDPAPGTPAGVNLSGLIKPTINEAGQTAFLALLVGAGVNLSNSLGIFSEGSGALALVARNGDPAPGAGPGVSFSNLGTPVLNAVGKTAFSARLTGAGVDDSNDESIWSERSGPLGPVAREGEQAPGMPTGVVFAGDEVAMIPAFGSPAMNGASQVVFQAWVAGPGIDDTNDEGIWGFDPVLGGRLLVREGETIEVAPGDTRTIMQLNFQTLSGGGDGKAGGFSDGGQLAFRVLFVGGTQGIFVTSDTDQDGTADAFDNCPNTVNPGQQDADGDGVGDACDGCPNDANKLDPGVCGCGVSDADSDGDGTPDCMDGCPNDPNKMDPGACGCGTADTDTDGDGVPDCLDNCPNDPDKLDPGICGCGVVDDITDTDGDGVPNCVDGCPDDPNKIEPGPCGCGTSDDDANGNGTPDCLEPPVAVDPVPPPPGGQPADGCAPLCGMGIGGPVPLMMLGLLGTKLCLRRRRRHGGASRLGRQPIPTRADPLSRRHSGPDRVPAGIECRPAS